MTARFTRDHLSWPLSKSWTAVFYKKIDHAPSGEISFSAAH
jgi:hypothetical protein